MPAFIYRIRPTRPEMLAGGPTARESEIVSRHFAYLQALTTTGQVLMAGRTSTTDARAFGIVVFTAASEADAEALVAGDPAVREGVMRAELWPFRVALWSDEGPPADI